MDRFKHAAKEITLLNRAVNVPCFATLREHGVRDDDVTVTWVPGAFELPTACRWLAQRGCDAVVMLGAIVRGGTDHYDYVCSGVTDGAMRVQLDLDVPVGFGVLTCADMDLAMARAGGDHGNKGCASCDSHRCFRVRRGPRSQKRGLRYHIGRVRFRAQSARTNTSGTGGDWVADLDTPGPPN